MENNRKVVVTAMGITSALGTGKDEFFKNCINGTIGINKCEVFSTDKIKTDYFGCINDNNIIYKPSKSTDVSRVEQISQKSANELLKELGDYVEFIKENSRKVCFCFGTLLGHTLNGLKYIQDNDKDTLAFSYEFINNIKKMFYIKGGSYVSSSACASGTTAIGMALDLIRSGKYDMAVIGGADPISEVSAYGFHSLKNLSTDICNPFDANRNGINIGEGSAFLFAETLENAKKRGATIYGEIVGYSLNNDAYHITSPDPNGSGAYMSMYGAVKDANIDLKDIQYINAHGTGTTHNDIMEIKAINRLFSECNSPLYVSSLKGQIGHCMGASGVLELVALLLAMKNNVYLPQPSIKEKMPEAENIEILNKSIDLNIEYALSNSFAFAGNTASVLIKNCNKE